ncbi:S-4TM family putative pore-forming effector [Chitinophaga filiformis]|uniref:Uncharacterized protein n=1 Tax=Chitinophaga filiformis TaxID=104663 RepID=A0A1G7MH03_CHIFI|nr:S-4TM family putative pore-forming effector [Chitinophaga filiformis]SDF60916.1 hypothetical protein SAMN04488121_102421 [Chitinophaga filiformis]
MDTIFTRQNEQKNIDLLCAQRQLYTEAKEGYLWQIWLTCPVAIFLGLLKLILSIWHIDINGIVIFCTIVVAMTDLLLLIYVINDNKKKAAKVQEEFDCTVYPLSWNEDFVASKNSTAVVTKYSNRYKKRVADLNNLYDWYPIELAKYEGNKLILHCQKVNMIYDKEIRQRFRVLALKVSIIPLVVLLLASVLINPTMQTALVMIAVFLPLLWIGIKTSIDQKKSISYSEETETIINRLLKTEDPGEKSIRSVQDRIYNNRIGSVFIPDGYYIKVRDELEKEMHDNAERA